jgi:hypothetical protein
VTVATDFPAEPGVSNKVALLTFTKTFDGMSPPADADAGVGGVAVRGAAYLSATARFKAPYVASSNLPLASFERMVAL